MILHWRQCSCADGRFALQPCSGQNCFSVPELAQMESGWTRCMVGSTTALKVLWGSQELNVLDMLVFIKCRNAGLVHSTTNINSWDRHHYLHYFTYNFSPREFTVRKDFTLHAFKHDFAVP